MLCEKCKPVRYQHQVDTKSKTWKPKHDACLFRHHANFQDLIQSALSCELCNLFKPFVEYAQKKQNDLAEEEDSRSQISGWTHDDPFEWFGETEELPDGGTLLHSLPEIRIGLTDGIFYEDEGDRYRWLTGRDDERYWHYQEYIHEVLKKEEEEDMKAGLAPNQKHQGHREVTTVLTLSAGSVDDRHLEEDKTICLDGEVFKSRKELAMKFPWLWKWHNRPLHMHHPKLKPHFEFYQHRDATNRIPQIRALNVTEDPKSNACFELVKRWLTDCEHNHRKCRNSWCFEKPTRLIDVGLKSGSQRCSLYTTDDLLDIFIDYATLSHCWGGDTSQMVKLLSSNVEQMQERIDVSTLEKTFQDAIEITRRMNIPYLWIDALCIIQDSKDDWSNEAPRMGQYYRGGRIMISALASPSSQSGILRPRVPSLPPVKLTVGGENVHLRVALEAAVTVQTYELWNDVRDELSEIPLRKRGWTLQEALFAPRILYFTSQQLVWQCQTCMTSEDNQYHWNCHNLKKRQHKKFMNLEPAPIATNDGPRLRPKVKNTGWYNMVQAFSNRKLTFLSDLLPAVSGLAREVHELTGAIYLAGLWIENQDAFLRNLLWTTYHHPHVTGREDTLPPRQSLNGSPSWSWASIAGSIEFQKVEIDYFRLAQPEIDPRLLNPQTRLTTGNQFGQVQGGRIAVIGTCHVYTGPLTFAAATARRKAELVERAEEKYRRQKERKLIQESKVAMEQSQFVTQQENSMIGNNRSVTEQEDSVTKQNESRGEASDEGISGKIVNVDNAITLENEDNVAIEDKDSVYSDKNVYLASMEWDAMDEGSDFEAFDQGIKEGDYGNHDLNLDVEDPDYDWTSSEHLILFMGRWDAWPIKGGLKETDGEQWFLVLKAVGDRSAEWEEAEDGDNKSDAVDVGVAKRRVKQERLGVQRLYEEPGCEKEIMGAGQGEIRYYERVGFAQCELEYQLPVTEEEGWTRTRFYFV